MRFSQKPETEDRKDGVKSWNEGATVRRAVGMLSTRKDLELQFSTQKKLPSTGRGLTRYSSH
jgi:hypothetical protein